MSKPSQLVDSSDRDRLVRLQLMAREVVDGLTSGLHASPHRGFSVQFKEHRPYVRGDDVRSMDWKLFGKTDRLYIRQFEEETNLRATLMVDQSRSMAYCGSRANGLSKHEFSVRLAACLAYMLVSQQDAVGLATFDSRVQRFIPPRSKPNHLHHVLECLASSHCAGETRLGDVLSELNTSLERRSLLILISDCFDDLTSLMRALTLFRHSKNEVIVFQIFDLDELDFPFHHRTQFRSLEEDGLSGSPGRRQRLVDPLRLRQSYLSNLQRFRAELAAGCAQQHIDLVVANTSESASHVLTRYLGLRGGVA